MIHSDRLKLRVTCAAEVRGDSKLEVTDAPPTNTVRFPQLFVHSWAKMRYSID